MENRKLITNFTIGLMSLAFLVSIGFNIFQYQQIRKLSNGAMGYLLKIKQQAM
jgi:hypothetical protein